MRALVRALALAWLSVGTAWAEPSAPKTSSLSWVKMPGAETCLSTQALARAVEERLGRSVFVPASAADLSVEARVEHQGATWRAWVVLRDVEGRSLGKREVSAAGAGCDVLREPLALVMAVMIDPDGTRDTPRAEATPAPREPEPRVIVQREEVPVPVYIEEKRAPSWLFEGSLAAITTLTPRSVDSSLG